MRRQELWEIGMDGLGEVMGIWGRDQEGRDSHQLHTDLLVSESTEKPDKFALFLI